MLGKAWSDLGRITAEDWPAKPLFCRPGPNRGGPFSHVLIGRRINGRPVHTRQTNQIRARKWPVRRRRPSLQYNPIHINPGDSEKLKEK
jgi:hypothetical protein